MPRVLTGLQVGFGIAGSLLSSLVGLAFRKQSLELQVSSEIYSEDMKDFRDHGGEKPKFDFSAEDAIKDMASPAIGAALCYSIVGGIALIKKQLQDNKENKENTKENLDIVKEMYPRVWRNGLETSELLRHIRRRNLRDKPEGKEESRFTESIASGRSGDEISMV